MRSGFAGAHEHPLVRRGCGEVDVFASDLRYQRGRKPAKDAHQEIVQ